MDRGTKRKAATHETPVAEGPPQKRQKTPDAYYVPITGETTASANEIGNKFIQQLKNARDKNGRLISTDFLTLPSKKLFPQYYEQVALPIAIDTLEAKLEHNQYTNLSNLESDVKRMVGNAKTFNENGSPIYLDAERIRKMTSNYMVKFNPAYKDKDYVAFMTPLPTSGQKAPSPPQTVTPAPVTKPSRRSASAIAPTPAIGEPEDHDEEEDLDFTGKTFQQAQQMIVKGLIAYKDDNELELYQAFVNLPSRTLTDYYSLIKQPTSLKGVLKKIQGVRSRHEITGATDLKSWDAFETEMQKIWDNAREYNEDGSDIYILAGDLEKHFKQRLSDAKQKVNEPHQPTLRLNLGAKPNPIKIRLGSSKPSPAPQHHASPSTTPGISVDKGALQRQKDMVEAGLSGNKLALAQTSKAQASPAAPIPGPLVRTSSGSGLSPPLALNGIKSERATAAASPLPATSNASMPPPPHNLPRLPLAAPSLTNGTLHAPQPIPQPHIPYHAPSTGLDNKWRPDGKDLSTALFQNLNITTHPDLHLNKPFHLDLPPNPTLTQQSITVNLPSTHTQLRLEPTLSTTLIASPSAPASASASNRPYKLFVTANGQRVQANYLPGTSRWQFDVKLLPGMNRVEVECVSAALKVPGQVQSGRSELELERVSIFAHLMRAL